MSTRNALPDFGSEVMAEALAQRALVKPVYTIPIIPLSSSNQYRHQDHLDMKDYKKVRPSMSGTVQNNLSPSFQLQMSVGVQTERQVKHVKCYSLWICPLLESIHPLLIAAECSILSCTLTHTRPWHFHFGKARRSKRFKWSIIIALVDVHTWLEF